MAAVYVASMFMNIMDSTVVNVALPSIAREFGVAVHATDGVVVGYLISLAVWIPAAGWAGDRLGTKRVFLVALTVFTVASVLCGQARSLSELVSFRVLQGVGGGMLTPVGLAMLYRAFPPRERARVAQILIIPTVVAPALGPVLGGFLVDRLSWRWAFYINLPIGALAAAFGLAFLIEHRESNAGRLDWRGFLLAGAGFSLLLLALSEGPAIGWLQPVVLGASVASVIALVALVLVERRHRFPLVDFGLFRNHLFTVTNIVSLSSSAGFMGLLFVTPLYLQEVIGVSAEVSGLTTFPEAIGVLLGAQLAGPLYQRFGPRRLLTGGLTWAAAWTGVLALLSEAAELWWIRVAMLLIGAGMAFVFLPLQTASFATISGPDTGRASALFSAQRQLAAALGVALLASVLAAFSSVTPQDSVIARGLPFRVAFAVAGVLLFLGALSARAIRDRDAASTMRPAR